MDLSRTGERGVFGYDGSVDFPHCRFSVVGVLAVSVASGFQLPTILHPERIAEGEVIESGETAPHDDIARRRVACAGEVSAESCDV